MSWWSCVLLQSSLRICASISEHGGAVPKSSFLTVTIAGLLLVRTARRLMSLDSSRAWAMPFSSLSNCVALVPRYLEPVLPLCRPVWLERM